MSEPSTPAARDPWERLGWLMGAVWVVFLYFPVASAATADTAPVWRAAGVALILAFGVVYLAGLVRTSGMDGWEEVARAGGTHLVVMVGLQLASAAVLGVRAVYLLPFVISLATFTLPLRAAAAVSVTGVAVSALVPLASGDLAEMGFFVGIVAMVAVFTMVIRVVNQRQLEHNAMAEELAMVAERERVARDVHDVLGHNLTVVTVKAELAERLLDVDPERARAELAEIRSMTREALAEIRATVSGLRVARLSDELAAARTALTGAGIAADVPDDADVVDPRHRIVLAWVLREAVTNVVRHSGASRCTVELGPALLRVTDDGTGLEGLREGNGLRGARERVAGAGGTLTVGPGTDGAGTTVEVRL
ncbi:sensor histidine kinase [Ornithinimicrobium pekingense]|uniref:Histidine kinase n=1 Tax=Ornithinimicrobium pekingense TaxID=384677 RepID=A0ABQ2FBJ9_9MICO|nr:sensor histidine kinase [Ornithinimicrobium pekingense]GGK78427.1 histidine kinase [Ornithinimicrobium pekingense]